MIKMRSVMGLSCLLIGVAGSAAGWAESSSSAGAQAPGPNGQPPAPPPEAIAACKGKAEGDKVTFAGRNGEQLSGVCRKIGSTLAAAPEGGRPGGPPPPR